LFQRCLLGTAILVAAAPPFVLLADAARDRDVDRGTTLALAVTALSNLTLVAAALPSR
jgi:hypothetical protein